MAETLLQGFSAVSLIDKYDVYQHFLTYWNGKRDMQDDVSMNVVADGWEAVGNIDKDSKKNKRLGRASLFQASNRLISRYFDAEQKATRKAGS